MKIDDLEFYSEEIWLYWMQGTAVLEWTQHHLKWEKIMVRLYKEVDLKDIRAQERERKREKKERKRERHRIKENNAFIGGILVAILDLPCALVTCFLFIYCWLAPTDCDLLLLGARGCGSEVNLRTFVPFCVSIHRVKQIASECLNILSLFVQEKYWTEDNRGKKCL